MAYHRIIPSLLLRDGRLVKGTRFCAWRDAGAPASTVRAYNAQMADEIVLLDIDATRCAREPALDVVEQIALEAEIPFTVGGGITGLASARRCFEAGADKIALGAILRTDPCAVSDIAARYGTQALVGCMDVVRVASGYTTYEYRDGSSSAVVGWLDEAERAVDAGIGELRLCVVDREGAREGYDLDAWSALRERVRVPIILEGGAGNLDHLLAAASRGVDSFGLGTMLVFSDNNIVQVKRHLKNAGVPVRL